jgi:hypothetical protein
MIFLWDKSYEHKKIILNENIKYIYTNTYISKNYKYIDNKITLGNKVIEYETISDRYLIEAYGVINFN